MHSESFAFADLRFFRRLSAQGYGPSSIYDIGASNGRWSEAVAGVYPDANYHLFEPLATRHPSYDKVLMDVMPRHPRFTLHPIALGNESGETVLHTAADGHSSSLLPLGGGAKELTVPGWRLEEYVKAQGLAQPDVLKMDVQGGEAFILEGAGDLLADVDVLLLETWLHRGYGPNTPVITELVAALSPLDFVLVDLGGPYFDEIGRLTAIDAFFLSKRILAKVDIHAGQAVTAI